MLRAICVTAKLSSCARKLGSSDETRSRVPDRAGSVATGSCVVACDSIASSAPCSASVAARSPAGSEPALASRSAPRSSVSAAARLTLQVVRSVGAGAGHGTGLQDGVQPVHVVDEPHDRARGRAEPGRAVGRREEARVQRSHGCVRVGDGACVVVLRRRLAASRARPRREAVRRARGMRRSRACGADPARATARAARSRRAPRPRRGTSRPAGRGSSTPGSRARREG